MDDSGDSVQLVVFRVGPGDRFALPIGQVQEVVRYESPRWIASDLPWLRGVTSLRGVVLPVLDLSIRLRLDGSAEPTRLLITTPDGDRAQVAYAAGDVEEIVTIPLASLDHAGSWHDPAVTAIAHVDGRIVVVLDHERLSDSTVFALDATPAVPEEAPR